MPISSQASQEEGSETRGKPHRDQAVPKRPAPTLSWGEDIVRSRRKRRAVEQAFRGNWEVSRSGCWEWTGGKSHGYGQVRVHEVWGSDPVYVHRLSYILHHGPIPDGLNVCHHCDNTVCFNPEHLFLGTHADNVADMVAKRRHGIGIANGMAKLTDQQVKAIRVLKAEGISQREIAKMFGVSEGHVSTLIKGKKRGSAGGAFHSEHGLAKWPEDFVLAIYDLKQSGVTIPTIMASHGLTDGQIRQILYGDRSKAIIAQRRAK